MKLNCGSSRSMVITRIGAALLVGGLLLSGCAATTSDTAETGPPPATPTEGPSPAEAPVTQDPEVEETETEETNAQNNGPATATVTLEGESFTFSPSTCLITEDDILVEAGGKNDATGDPAFLSIDFNLSPQLNGEVKVSLGTDNPFESTDDYYKAFFGEGDQEKIDAAFPQATLAGTFLEPSGEEMGEGTVNVLCG